MKHEKQVWEKSRMELFRGLGCQESGLTQADAKSRLEKYGVNELHAGKQKSVLQIFLGQFADFLVLILILAAVISACMGDVESMIVILTVITMNAILGTVQTVKAAASLDSLKQMSAPTAKVLRDGQIVQIPGREVVPGNVVILEAGDSVCADGRLLECASLKCAESALTGESLPVEKDTDEISGETALGDRKNMVFSGSFVTYGRGRFLVTATGMDTEMGKIVLLLKSTEERKTPLQVSLDQFGKKLSIIIMPEERKNIEQVNEQFSNEGLRVLAFACRRVDSTAVSLADENGLNFLGLIAMLDPPREESKAAAAECIRAGIRPIMITGDHKITAAAIAREIGILRDGTEAVEGAVIDKMSVEELRDFVPQVSVYARVSPEHKIRIVRAWQQRGNLVAMTGDGVNDAPALKQADIGVAMGITGTEVAKDAAGMVLADDNFATIVKAVKNGRNAYANIKRAVQFLLSGNTAGILTVLYASLMGLPVPFSAVHLLFINLLTDSLPAIALGLEPHTDEVMREKPRPRNEDILTKPFLLSVGMEGLVIAAATITAFYLGLSYGGAAAGQTMAFSTLCLSRLFHSFSCKSQHPVLLTRKFWNNRALLGAFAAGSLLLGLVLLVPALEPLFSVAPLSVGMISAVVGLAFCSMLTIQLLKRFRR